ncbi:anaerobic sulfatase maturase [Salmonella enterica]|nr:anaerobic sulfatase maturase [Salmonella enterica]EDV4942549.1 anaerobic sulfatase maturase [Salmonella enterica subsp. arizonae]EAS9679023.1 anaerobic sulfatase maturase [Salmonella enterica]EBP0189729.1 anaerobic sulfatase maturase [Salmonella enterica]ECF9748395.1 anaerobic sulfatase maturase [Salmonella enterica]
MNMSPTQRAYFHMMAKPVSYRCNLHCEYCFYLEKETMLNARKSPEQTMSDSMLRRYIRDYLRSHAGDTVDFAWQGGEPTLAGLDFYRKAVAYQQQYADGKTITNSFQTNAIAINRQWADFFAENRFLIGVSVDGIAEIHDKYRIAVNGQPTFERVNKSIALLREYKVDFNTLTVVNDQNYDKGRETYQALKALGSTFLQFIPIVEVDARCLPHTKGHYSPPADAVLSPFSVPADGYGRFMNAVFDAWVKEDVGSIYIREFDSLLGTWMGYPASTCVQAITCGQALIIETNGDIYSCDHYVYPAYLLGNIANTSLVKMATSRQQQRFGNVKQEKLTQMCQQCEVKALCQGGCPKHRIVPQSGEKHKHNYLCASYKHFFYHTAPVMQAMSKIIQSGGVAADIMPLLNKFNSH